MKLYHATYKKLLRKIKRAGFLGNSPYKLWSDSNNKYVYLADNPDEAYSYAETALDEIENERLYDMLEDDEIVVLEIDSSNLDLTKLQKDTNNLGETTYQYEGTIPVQFIKKFNYNKWISESFNGQINKILSLAGVQLNEENEYVPFILPDPSYKQFHDFFRLTTYGKISAIIDDGHIYCWDSGYAHHGRMIKYIEQSLGIKISNDSIWVRFKEPNLCWVSAEYFNEYDDDELVDLPEQEFEKNLENNPIIRKYYPNGVKIIRFDRIDESIAYVSKKDLSDIILKNPTKRELRENNLTLCRCMEDSEGNWYFTNMENMLHAYIVYELRDEAYFPLFDGNDCYGIAYYDAESNEFWYNLNDYMYKKECIEQYNNSEYLRTTFPNARVIPNPWNDQGYDDLYESIAFVSKKDLSDIILKNPTRKEILEYDNPVLKHQDWRIAEDNNGNYYFGSGYDWIHFEMCNALKKQGIDIDVDFSDYDGVASYDSKTNTFYIRDDYGESELIEQEFNNSYLKKAFPNAKLEIDVEYDELYESIIHAEKSNYDDYMAVVLKNPTKRELRENGLDRSRFICFEDGTWLFFDSMQWIHAHIWDKYKDKFNGSNNMGFYDLSNNEFIFIESLDYDENEEGYEEEVSYYENKCKKWLLTKPYIRETFGLNPNVTVYGDCVDNPW